METFKFSDYCGYTETYGVLICKDCEKQLWISYPEEGDEVECDCGCIMELIEE